MEKLVLLNKSGRAISPGLLLFSSVSIIASGIKLIRQWCEENISFIMCRLLGNCAIGGLDMRIWLEKLTEVFLERMISAPDAAFGVVFEEGRGVLQPSVWGGRGRTATATTRAGWGGVEIPTFRKARRMGHPCIFDGGGEQATAKAKARFCDEKGASGCGGLGVGVLRLRLVQKRAKLRSGDGVGWFGGGEQTTARAGRGRVSVEKRVSPPRLTMKL
jgi:hypothetical protein